MLMRRSPVGSNTTPLGFDTPGSGSEMDISSGGVLNLNIQVSTQNVGSNTPHNNMPPYLAVRYIIKAKPYTRAAIIDGVDIPYSSLLVRGTLAEGGDIRSRSIGGRNDDLVLYTNTASDSGTGTERVRILGSNGSVGIGKTPGVSLDVNGTGIFTRLGVGVSTTPTVAFDVSGTSRFTGSVGVNTATPSVALDIVGALRVSDFDGSNVLVKPRNTPTTIANIGTVGMVGQVIPLFIWAFSPYYQSRSQTAPIPFGKWFVYFSCTADHLSGYNSENPTAVMAGIWDVPANEYLCFANRRTQNDLSTSNTVSGVYYKYFTNISNISTDPIRTADIPTGLVDSSWTEMTIANGQAVGMHGYDPSGMSSNWRGLVYQPGAWVTPVNTVGYAMRIG